MLPILETWGPLISSMHKRVGLIRLSQVLTVNEKPGQKFEVTLDVSHYLPEELKVTVSDNVLSVQARHQAKDEDSAPGMSSSSVREFSRKWTLPESCRLVTSSFQLIQGPSGSVCPRKKWRVSQQRKKGVLQRLAQGAVKATTADPPPSSVGLGEPKRSSE